MSTTRQTPAKPDAPLRALRLWHWEEAMRWRAKSKEYREAAAFDPSRWVRLPDSAVKMDETANFHIRAVQVLNDLFPVGDTAATDLRKKNRRAMRPSRRI